MNFENGLFEFNNDKTECIIKQNKNNRTPLAWSNILTNQTFGTIVTEGMGGFSWYINSRTNKITKFSNDPYKDKSSEYFLLEEQDNAQKETANQYSLDVNQKPDENEYITTFGLGYSKFEHETEKIKTSLEIFVPITKEDNEEEKQNKAENESEAIYPNNYSEASETINTNYYPEASKNNNEDNKKISILNIKNKTNKKQVVKIKYVIDILMAENEKESYIKETYKENFNMIVEENLASSVKYLTYITCSESINQNKEIYVELKANEEKEIVFILGVVKDEIEALKSGTSGIQNYKKELIKTKDYWKDLTQKCVSKTPDNAFDILQNGWLAYQTIASRLYARSGFYQTSGAFGFRDQMQDAIGMKWVDENILKRQIIFHAKHQFKEGDVMHWWHEDQNLGIRTKYSDDLLFLPYGVIEYIDFTGDYTILYEKAKYVIADELKENEKDKVINYKYTENEETIFEHTLKAIQRASKLGKNNMLLMQGGDWNDGMNKIGEKGRGESVWLSFFMYEILRRIIPILKHEEQNINKIIFEERTKTLKADNKDQKENKELCQNSYENESIENNENESFIKKLIEEFEEMMRTLKHSTNNIGWDSRWFKRAIDDEGNDIGSNTSEECKINNEVQAWAVISDCADNDKKYIAMQSLVDLLVDEKANLVKLLAPPLSKQNLGYISSYPKGIRENGGQYTHALLWDVIAMCKLNKNDEAYNLLKKANPVEHTRSKEAIEIYKVEPYVVAADIYWADNLKGHGGWTWYTGSSAWMYETQIKYILGINVYHKTLTIIPHVPSTWQEYEVTFRYKNAIYHIKAKRLPETNNDQNQKQDFEPNQEQNFKSSQETYELKENGVYNINVYYK